MVLVLVLVTLYSALIIWMQYKSRKDSEKLNNMVKEIIISNGLYKDTTDRILKSMEMLDKDIESLDKRINKMLNNY